jgi:two-component system, chemotaxis family, sensor histidine kinase and response regulator WspE
MKGQDLSQASMWDLFRLEAEEHLQVLTAGLLALEREAAPAQLEGCMRAAHSLKGAARVAAIEAGVRIAHTMESCFVAAQRQRVRLQGTLIDRLLRAADLLRHISQWPEDSPVPVRADAPEVIACISALEAALEHAAREPPAAPPAAAVPTVAPSAGPPAEAGSVESEVSPVPESDDRFLRVTAQHLNHLLGLAAESLVESRWLRPFADSLLRIKRQHRDLMHTLQRLHESLPEAQVHAAQTALREAEQRAAEAAHLLAQRLEELEAFERRVSNLSTRLYDGALACRMRPFSDVTRAMPRMVRDLAQRLGKQVRLQVEGQSVEVDREVLQKLEAPLGHLLRNAVDHGIEAAQARLAAGKVAEGRVRVHARHLAGQLNVLIEDDGAGIDQQSLRNAIRARSLAADDVIARLSVTELYSFLLLPGFSLATSVTDISGRGIGLDVVNSMLQQMRGSVHILSERGVGTRFELQVPLTLSLVRALLVEIGGEPYAFPLACIVTVLRVGKEQIVQLQGRPYVELGAQRAGLIGAHQLFETAAPAAAAQCAVVVIGTGDQLYGLIVDRLLEERELVVQPLDPRLGKLRNISAGALMEDGSPVLIVDSEDLLRSIERFILGEGVGELTTESRGSLQRRRRVLVVDDSLTVRELERKLLANRGYEVDVAVDGMDGWNAVRTRPFDLVITDVDMPRMDGIEFVTLIKADARLQRVPVMIVSYKDRPEDRQRGLQAGADYYLAKSSFQDSTLLDAVTDLIGAALQ